MKCRKCSHEYEDDLLECPNCGYQPFSELNNVDVPEELKHYSKEELYSRIKAQTKAKKYFILMVLAVLCIVIITFINQFYQDKKQYENVSNIREGLGLNTLNAIGNTSGNISNGGIASSSGGYLYVLNEKYQLIRMEPDFSRYEILNYASTTCINVVGNHVYFVAKEDNSIYRVNLATKVKTKIVEHAVVTMQVVGDWIYYIDKEDTNSIYSIKKDGTNKRKLTSQSSDDICIYGDYIYYNVEDVGVYRMPLRGDTQELVFEHSVKISDINIIDDWLYFISDNQNIYRVNLNNLQSLDAVYSGEVTNLIISDNRLYFIEGNQIIRTNLNASNPTTITGNKTDQFNVISTWIIYYHLEENCFYKISKYEDIDIPLIEANSVDNSIDNTTTN